mmetsp:Transcript_21856/g.48840  ORF Transcript_21856/g.48840 Transcript_21856/m.48840 type:complete len:281 (-) Transcript_21856:500-1342(-)
MVDFSDYFEVFFGKNVIFFLLPQSFKQDFKNQHGAILLEVLQVLGVHVALSAFLPIDHGLELVKVEVVYDVVDALVGVFGESLEVLLDLLDVLQDGAGFHLVIDLFQQPFSLLVVNQLDGTLNVFLSQLEVQEFLVGHGSAAVGFEADVVIGLDAIIEKLRNLQTLRTVFDDLLVLLQFKICQGAVCVVHFAVLDEIDGLGLLVGGFLVPLLLEQVVAFLLELLGFGAFVCDALGPLFDVDFHGLKVGVVGGSHWVFLFLLLEFLVTIFVLKIVPLFVVD